MSHFFFLFSLSGWLNDWILRSFGGKGRKSQWKKERKKEKEEREIGRKKKVSDNICSDRESKMGLNANYFFIQFLRCSSSLFWHLSLFPLFLSPCNSLLRCKKRKRGWERREMKKEAGCIKWWIRRKEHFLTDWFKKSTGVEKKIFAPIFALKLEDFSLKFLIAKIY